MVSVTNNNEQKLVDDAWNSSNLANMSMLYPTAAAKSQNSHTAPLPYRLQDSAAAASIPVPSHALYLSEATRHNIYTQQLRCQVHVCTIHMNLLWIRMPCKLHNSCLLLWLDYHIINLLMTRISPLCDLCVPAEEGDPFNAYHSNIDTAALQRQAQPSSHASRRAGSPCMALDTLLAMHNVGEAEESMSACESPGATRKLPDTLKKLHIQRIALLW